jgi:hypothetical protein
MKGSKAEQGQEEKPVAAPCTREKLDRCRNKKLYLEPTLASHERVFGDG